MNVLIIPTLILISTFCEANYVNEYPESEEISPQAILHGKPDTEYYNDPSLVDNNNKEELNRLSDLLASILREDWGNEGLPLLYVEEEPPMEAISELTSRPWKRTRYYRRYPWKRQNSRSRPRYEADNPYMCQPTRDDVFKLLVALHETRSGNGGRSINFCNRRRSAGAIFTNIRFLGRRK